jgi:hypothetical protein
MQKNRFVALLNYVIQANVHCAVFESLAFRFLATDPVFVRQYLILLESFAS